MLTSQALRIRKTQQIEELRHRLHYCTSAEERALILQSLNFWTRFQVPADADDPYLETTSVTASVTLTPKGVRLLPHWLSRRWQPAIH